MTEGTIRRIVAVLLTALAIGMSVSCTSRESAPRRETAPSPISAAVKVPDVVGLDGSDAETALKNVGLSVEVSVVTGDYTNGAVIRQRPTSGKTVEPGTTIHVVVGPAITVG